MLDDIMHGDRGKRFAVDLNPVFSRVVAEVHPDLRAAIEDFRVSEVLAYAARRPAFGKVAGYIVPGISSVSGHQEVGIVVVGSVTVNSDIGSVLVVMGGLNL